MRRPSAGWAGSTRVVVLDNLREGVLKPDIYDPTLNPLYRDMLQHYGAVALPCRVADPDRKAYVSYCTLSRLRATLKVGCLARRPPWPFRIAPWSNGS